MAMAQRAVGLSVGSPASNSALYQYVPQGRKGGRTSQGAGHYVEPLQTKSRPESQRVRTALTWSIEIHGKDKGSATLRCFCGDQWPSELWKYPLGLRVFSMRVENLCTVKSQPADQ